MNRVLDRLFIGAAADLDGATPLRSLGFTAIVDLCGVTQMHGGVQGLPVFYLPNRDGDSWDEAQVEEAFGFIREFIRSGRVLVACAAGMSRSASIVIGYLVRCGWSPPEAFAHVKRARTQIAPVPSMIESALR